MPKRLFDTFFSFLGLIMLSPAFLIISFLIRVSSSGPVFFRQERVGKNGKIFKIYKFRTMQKDAPYIGNKFATPKDDPRITKVGYILRRTNIDELPQLINIIRGEMSLVGPRPEVPEVVNLYEKEYKKILLIKPGMTDFASLEFRREDDILASAKDAYRYYIQEIVPKKLELNFKYLEKQSFLLDTKLIFKTIFKIISDAI